MKRNRKLNSVVVLDICVQVNARNWIFTLGGKWICTAHGRVVDVNDVVVVGDIEHVVVIVDQVVIVDHVVVVCVVVRVNIVVVVVGDLLLLIGGLIAAAAAAYDEKDYEDDHKNPPPLPLKHFGLEKNLKVHLQPISEFGWHFG